MELRGKTAVVVGLGRSGLAAIHLLGAAGCRVRANDKKGAGELGSLAADAQAHGAELFLGGHPDEAFEGADLVVLSPGVPHLEAVRHAREHGARVVSEVELASWFLASPVIGITGTNGKSTVTTLVGEMLKRTGKPTFVGGNLGDALTLAVGTPAAQEGGQIVAELSSFQLEDIDTLRCRVAVLLNVTDDHLDRHGTFASYAAAKGRIFLTQTEEDHAIVPAGDALCLSLAHLGRGRVHTYGGRDGEVRIESGELRDMVSGLRFPTRELGIRGLHNQANACAASLAARLAGASIDDVAHVLRTFQGLPHRMVLVRELDGVSYFDDSKATNVGATVAAIDGLADHEGQLVLIAGGVDKGGSYEPVRQRMDRRGRAVVLLGAAAPLLRGAFTASPVPLHDASTIDDAVAKARALAKPGDAVLLAPACASFDMFKSYAHRGDEFARAVRALPEGGAS
ncbi:MAG: UDP-N-acetylmuramoyl-L-alanine--D-glutamate ligase [Sandaracinus sp.]|jgi:UDP-N-acetylmuramoylalanine--D-glutamate ligase